MEQRQLMSAQLLSNGNLTVLGTFGNDSIGMTVNTTNGTVIVNDNGITRTFPLNKVKSVYVNTLDGNDYFSASTRLTMPMVIYGGSGNDNLTGGGGNDQVDAGPGNDTLFNSPGSDSMNGGSDFDQIWYSSSTAPVSVTLDDSANDGLNNGYFKSREFDNVHSDIEEVHGSAYGDFLSAAGLYGRGATLYGYYGDDYLVGSDNADALHGDFGKDTIIAQGGDDQVWGGQGADLMIGGYGFDTVRYDGADEGRIRGVVVSLPEPNTYPYEGNNGAAGENDRLAGDFEAIVGTNFNDGLSGNSQNNLLMGLSGDDWMQGRGGNDTLYGYAGNDMLFGDAGNDYVFGGDDNDTIYGGTEADYLAGENGNDYIYSKDGAYSDTLTGGAGYDIVERDRSYFTLFGRRRMDTVYDAEYFKS